MSYTKKTANLYTGVRRNFERALTSTIIIGSCVGLVWGCGPSQNFSYIARNSEMSHLLNSTMMWGMIEDRASQISANRCPQILGIDKNDSEATQKIYSLIYDDNGSLNRKNKLENIGFSCSDGDHEICRYTDEIFVTKSGFWRPELNGNSKVKIDICIDLTNGGKPTITSSSMYLKR